MPTVFKHPTLPTFHTDDFGLSSPNRVDDTDPSERYPILPGLTRLRPPSDPSVPVPQGKVKRRIQPEDIIINIGKEAQVPEPPAGHKWREVRHDNSVTWLASWTENIQGQIK